MEVFESNDRVVGNARVRRALPQRTRRTVGAWCFADHLGPLSVDGRGGLDIGPHPHTGLATVTWLVEGQLLHKDSLGSEQPISPGQLNLMHAGEGVAHAEEQLSQVGTMHGIQMWVAQPETTRHGAAGFEHHAELPRLEVPGGVATVLLGSLDDTASPARTDTALVGAELVLQPGTSSTWPLQGAYEHALVVLSGAVHVDDEALEPGSLGHLGVGREELVLDALEPTRVMLVGGEPFEASLAMHWNFVGRSREEVRLAAEQWNARDERFGTVDSRLTRIPAPIPH
jgi:redox-sensitive bicupin YhaK (pirin superfamily)